MSLFDSLFIALAISNKHRCVVLGSCKNFGLLRLRFVDFVSETNQVDVSIDAILGPAFGLSFIANHLGILVTAGASLQL
jgi:hypothetical protein